ncbi:MAG TPA: CBS domain-containing protein [Gemmatimonadota bacterium]|nr:CBS domain-containing protein [Gemmatimonadota bacterium]
MAEATTTQPVLTAAQVAPPLEATSYAETLDELAAFAVRQPGVGDGERFLRQISALGAEDTIAVGGGAFLPHLRSDAIDRVVVALGITARPLRVPTETGEEARGRLFVLIAAPPGASGEYLEAVATLAALLRREGVIDEILAAEDGKAVAALEPIREAPRVQKLSVVDVMEPAAHRVYPDMSLDEAARLMVRGRHRGLPVVNRNDEIVGMISEKDLIRDFLPAYLRLFDSATSREGGDRLVKDVMSKAVLCLPTEASISEAASIIVNKNVDPLPLTREGRWVGLISRRSLIRKLLQF